MDIEKIDFVKQEVESLHLLNQEDVELIKTIRCSMDKYQPGMTDFQIEKGVLSFREFPTPDSRYWQCWREMFVRYSNLGLLQFQHNKGKLEMEKLGLEVEEQNKIAKTELEKVEIQLKENEIASKLFSLEVNKVEFNRTLHELKVFYREMKRADQQRKFSTRNQAEEEFWTKKEEIRQMEEMIGFGPEEPKGMIVGINSEEIYQQVKEAIRKKVEMQQTKTKSSEPFLKVFDGKGEK